MKNKSYIRFLVAIGIVIFFISSNTPTLAAVFIGERIDFSPTNPKPGDEVAITVFFRIEGGPVTALNMTITTDPAGAPTPPPPTIVGNWGDGSHNRKFTYTLPLNAPPRICFTANVMIDGRMQPIVSNACLETSMRVVSTGTGNRTIAVAGAPAAPTNVNGPDIRIQDFRTVNKKTGVFIPVLSHIVGLAGGDPVINVDTDAYFEIRVQNIGRATANRVRTHIEYNIADRWVPFSEPNTVAKIDPGKDVLIKVERRIPRGATGIKVKLDPFNEMLEADENNNTYVGYFSKK